MSDTAASLARKLRSAGDLQSVVRTMKAIAGSRIVQYDAAVRALGDYDEAVELGLGAYLRAHAPPPTRAAGRSEARVVGALVFGSDQGLVGQFNQALAAYVVEVLGAQPGRPQVWAVGERIYDSLEAAGLPIEERFAVPASVKAIVPLVARLQVDGGALGADRADGSPLYVFHNQPRDGLYAPTHRRLLPLDAEWIRSMAQVPWPTRSLPQVLPRGTGALRALIGEYLSISIIRACAESLASENASRLAAMERADRNIDELSETLLRAFHRLRQDGIDEELFDVVSGYEALG